MRLGERDSFIADSWIPPDQCRSPIAYTHPTAARVRETGGVSGDREAVRAYVAAIDLPGAIAALKKSANSDYLQGLVLCFETMWALALEIMGDGPAVPYETCVQASTGKPPEPSSPAAKRERVAELLGIASRDDLPEAVDAWRKAQAVPMASIRVLGAAIIGHFEALTAKHVAPHLPVELRSVPSANIEFLPIRDAWFSGSMNYLGRARRPDGSPEI